MMNIAPLLETARKDEHAELEVKLLAGMIQTPDVAARIRKAIRARAVGEPKDTHYLRQIYPDGRRVEVEGAEVIHKVCTSGSFRNLPLIVQSKRRYFEKSGQGQDTIDLPDLSVRFTLRHEEVLRKDFSGVPGDPAAYLRVLHRQSWRSVEGHWQFDLSMVKSRDAKQRSQTLRDVLKNPPSYELEIELLDREAPVAKLQESLEGHIRAMVAAFQGSPFVLTQTDLRRYSEEWRLSRQEFINAVTLERRHLRAERPGTILRDYTVTNKADGERCMLFVTRDKRLLRITNKQQITWTGIVAIDDSHVGTTIDGEYIAGHNRFCIFDVYRYRGQDTRNLPLMTRDTDPPKTSRLGHAKLFVDDLRTAFVATAGGTPIIETKLFLAGNGPAMETAITRMLQTKFEYPTDGLIFTPRASPLAPMTERRGNTWLRVYKWKPPHQNSIDFLFRAETEPTYDPVLRKRARKGTLYVTRSAGTDLVYPCQQLTGEYIPPELPADLARLAEMRDRVPSVFQPSSPRSPDAHTIYIPVNAKGVMYDIEEERIEDNTIIECSYDTENLRWRVMRTRYDKTYEYRVLKAPQYGNDVQVADNIWTSIHVPVTEDMLTRLTSHPPDDTFEDELYYRDTLDSRDRILRDVYGFHNRIKDSLYKECLQPGQTLLELAVGRAGDLHKWIHSKPSRVVGIEINESNLNSPRQGACARVLRERSKGAVPPVLLIPADMTQPLTEQNHPYLKILRGEEPPTTPYLEGFAGLTQFDAVSCQFAIHYACSSEDTFRAFVSNLTGTTFFGTCLDGQSVYSFLLGQKGHVFRSRGKVYGEFTKDYKDGEGWTEAFGMGIHVLLESFEKPSEEFLVPFGKVTEILGEAGFQLVHSEMFSEHYSQQNEVRLTQEQQAFSLLHRSFVFRRAEAAEPRAEEPEPKAEETAAPAEPAPAPEPKEGEKAVVIKKATRKLKPKPEPEGPPPVFFMTADESKGDNRFFSHEYVAPTMIDGIKYPTVEHYMVAQKARQFGDEIAFQKVLKAKTAKSAKGVEKSIKDVKEDEWEARQEEVMRTALRAKFTQHPELRAKLLDTGERPFAYANPRDKYWSIGTSEDTDKAKNPAKWPGKNRLGVLLGELRATLRGETA